MRGVSHLLQIAGIVFGLILLVGIQYKRKMNKNEKNLNA
jgi:hypothetical protein